MILHFVITKESTHTFGWVATLVIYLINNFCNYYKYNTMINHLRILADLFTCTVNTILVIHIISHVFIRTSPVGENQYEKAKCQQTLHSVNVSNTDDMQL